MDILISSHIRFAPCDIEGNGQFNILSRHQQNENSILILDKIVCDAVSIHFGIQIQ